MSFLNRKEPLVLLMGDLFFLVISLWLTLFVRYGVIPSDAVFLLHLEPFAVLFLVWILVFYIAGLYEKHTTILKNRLPSILGSTQLANSSIAVVFFYFVPFFGITPKTILFIYLFVSFLTILIWRMYGYFVIGRGVVHNAIIIGSGLEMKEIINEVNKNNIYNLRFVSSIDLNRTEGDVFWKEIISRIYTEEVAVIVIDLSNEKVDPILPHLYNLIFSNVNFIDMHKIYETIFDRAPLSLLKYNWFLENISTSPRAGYDAMKRIMDILISIPLLAITLPFWPFIMLAIKLESSGPALLVQERFGQNNKIIRLLKFRSMRDSDGGKWLDQEDERITQVGKFLRKSRLDELPQLWNVLKGDISLIGPRPDIYNLGVKLQEEIPYYNVRNVIKPGLSGWAQIKQDIVPQSVQETKERLSYDLYYIKNRSFFLDLRIALRTIKTLASRVGR